VQCTALCKCGGDCVEQFEGLIENYCMNSDIVHFVEIILDSSCLFTVFYQFIALFRKPEGQKSRV